MNLEPADSSQSDGFLHITGVNNNNLSLVFSALQIDRPSTFDFFKTFTENNLDSDVIFIRDSESLWYQAGTQGAYGSFLDIIMYLKKHMQSYNRVVTFGASMGGYAALAVMPYIPKISSCLAISPQTFIDAENRAKFNDTRWEDDSMRCRMKIINKALHKTPFFDLKSSYERLYDCKRPVYIMYGSNAREDKIHAEYLQHVNGVKLYEIQGGDHFVAQMLKDNGSLVNIVKQVLRDEEPSRIWLR